MGCRFSAKSHPEDAMADAASILPRSPAEHGKLDPRHSLTSLGSMRNLTRRLSSIVSLTEGKEEAPAPVEDPLELVRKGMRKRRESVLFEDTTKLVHTFRNFVKPRTLSLDDLDVFQTVGCGGYGRVRLCYLKQQDLDAVSSEISTEEVRQLSIVPCALKILNKIKVAKKFRGSIVHAAEAIRDEVEILGQIEFPFIVGVLKIFHDPQRVFVLMEFCTGGELYKVIHSRDSGLERNRISGGVTPRVAQHWIGELVLTLEYLHQRHTVYRDLKPENCMLDHQGHVKLVDFGMAKRLEPKNHFRTKTNCGTLIYQAPEMLLNRPYSIEPDWWALGVLVFEVFMLRCPWDWSRDITDHFNIQQAIMAVNIRWGKRGGVDRVTKDLINTLLVFNPEKRIAGLIAKLKDHKFFKGIEWNLLLNKQVPVPFVMRDCCGMELASLLPLSILVVFS
ncbi:hypothetical protein FOZ62_016032 [Perkinsus olseni]|uniref:Protein kinase domain-containing protein n=1 Tax=Perkinsus olseni TaxID=32597 RepID=A0A7J6PX65_PEROL|nr:hypothetical protein FOZ62_016032 [Perkinsus olseni]